MKKTREKTNETKSEFFEKVDKMIYIASFPFYEWVWLN